MPPPQGGSWSIEVGILISMKRKYILQIFLFCFMLMVQNLQKINGQVVVYNSGIDLKVETSTTITINASFDNKGSGTIDNDGTIRVTGDWANNGITPVFSTTSGTVVFTSTNSQDITGPNPTSFNNL